jgi:hypothetical protein
MARTKKPIKMNVFWPPPGGKPYKVKDGDMWQNVAKKHKISSKKLIYFNFRTNNTDEVNWYLENYVGCKKQTLDKNNYMFSSSADPGIIFIPPENFDFEGDVISGKIRPGNLLDDRWDNFEDDVSAGRLILQRLLNAAYAQAKIAKSPAKRALSTAPKSVEDHGLPGFFDLIKNIAAGIEDVAISGQAKEVNKVRFPLYQQFAKGVVSKLDPDYHPNRGMTSQQQTFFFLGLSEVDKLNILQRYQLMLALTENLRNFGPISVAHFERTPEKFHQNFGGSKLVISIMNELSKNKNYFAE